MFNLLYTLATQREGFTFSLTTGKAVTSGIVAAYAETQNAFGLRGFIRAYRHARAHSGVIGGWFDTKSGRYYFDSVRVFTTRAEAVEFGRQNHQLAVFDLDNLEEIRL